MNAQRGLAYPEVKHPSASGIRIGTGPGSEHKEKNKKKESVSLSAAVAPCCPQQRKEPSGAEDYTNLLGLVGWPTGRKAARSLADKEYKEQTTLLSTFGGIGGDIVEW